MVVTTMELLVGLDEDRRRIIVIAVIFAACLALAIVGASLGFRELVVAPSAAGGIVAAGLLIGEALTTTRDFWVKLSLLTAGLVMVYEVWILISVSV